MSKHEDLYDFLLGMEMLDYGKVIPAELIRDTLGLEMPAVGTKAQFDAVALAELAAVDYLRRRLLHEGKYIAGDRGNYRILLPSENKRQVEAYMSQADTKLKRASLLLKNTPQQVSAPADNTAARLLLKMESTRAHA